MMSGCSTSVNQHCVVHAVAQFYTLLALATFYEVTNRLIMEHKKIHCSSQPRTITATYPSVQLHIIDDSSGKLICSDAKIVWRHQVKPYRPTGRHDYCDMSKIKCSNFI